MISVAMRTVKRPVLNFVGSTLRNLRRSGLWDSPHLARLTMVDSGSNDADFLRRAIYSQVPSGLSSWQFGVDLPENGHRRTHTENGARALEVAAKVPCDWVLILEDDLDVIDGFLDAVLLWLSRHADDRVLLYTFGGLWSADAGDVVRVPLRSFYGAQAYAMRRTNAVDCAAWLREHPTHSGPKGPGEGLDLTPGPVTKNHDLLLPHWAQEIDPNTHILASAPSFVQHIGHASTLNNEFFEFPSWPGRAWRYR